MKKILATSLSILYAFSGMASAEAIIPPDAYCVNSKNFEELPAPIFVYAISRAENRLKYTIIEGSPAEFNAIFSKYPYEIIVVENSYAEEKLLNAVNIISQDRKISLKKVDLCSSEIELLKEYCADGQFKAYIIE